MQAYRKRAKRGFSLVELLAVVLVLAVLAAVAVPLYISQRKSAAGRACKANIAAIANAASAYALRNGAYPATGAAVWSSKLVGANEGLAKWPACPLGADYTCTTNADGSAEIACPNDGAHAGFGGAAGDWTVDLAKPGADSLP
ncbi:MAG: prepilin-type N-terminal cleavage/methylation domain-containing protein [Chthonomonadales bacterium]|nr:prepilin-type N-terminal cleavage/methylation domain-containing protein [Chthonomonadales bacterium]